MVEVMESACIACIRVSSGTNEWLDCIFLVDEKDKEKAIEVLKKAFDDFWEDGEGWCYGDFLEARLAAAGIAFDAYYKGLED